MQQFRAFLQNTAGSDFLLFWLDCEKFKDTMEDYDDLELIITRNRLYRFVDILVYSLGFDCVQNAVPVWFWYKGDYRRYKVL